MWKEYVALRLIGTPLEAPARSVQGLKKIFHKLSHPELAEIYHEDTRINAAFARLIKPDTNCIDIGCHLGSVLTTFERLAPRGKHIGVEPTPYKARWLRAKHTQSHIMQCALSDCNGPAEFFYNAQQSGFSGLRKHGNSDRVESFEVECRRLDDLVPSDRPIGFVKVDVEGGELHALRGGCKLLERCHPPILFECSRSALDGFGIDAADMYALLVGQLNYDVYLLKDWLAGAGSLTFKRMQSAMTYPFQAFNFLAL